MISDRSLLRLASLLAAAGIAALFAAAFLLEPRAVTPSEISASMAGEIVELSGAVTSASSSSGHVFLSVDGLRIVVFEKQASKQPWAYDLRKGDAVEVRGKVAVYKGEVEVIADTIVSQA